MVTFKDNSKKASQALDAAVKAALLKIGISAKENIKEIIISKDIYDTGALHRSIDYKIYEDKKRVDVGSPKDYAVFNELGTFKMRARPFIRPGILDKLNEYKVIVSEVLALVFKA